MAEATPPAAPSVAVAAHAPPVRHGWLAVAFICLALLVISLNNTLLNIALPAIAEDLGASATQLQWIVDAYLLVFASLQLTMGTLGDAHGRKRALQLGLVVFLVVTVLAGFAGTVQRLIFLRGIMGIGAAAVMPATLSLVSSVFPDPARRAQAIAFWAAAFGLGIGIGPPIGGFLVGLYSWSAAFFVNVPVVVVALLGVWFFVRESKDPNAPPPDVLGAGLSIVGLVALVLGIEEAGVKGWTSLHALLPLGVALVTLAAFGIWEVKARYPMLPMYLFTNMSFTGANIALTMMTFGLMGSLFFFGQYFQVVKGYTPFEAGLSSLPLAVVVVLLSAASARIAQRIGIQRSVAGGLMLAALGLLGLSVVIRPDTPYLVLVLGLVVMGAGIGVTAGPATSSVMGSVPLAKAGVGSAMNDTTRELGGALGIAVLGAVADSTYLSRLREAAAMYNVPVEVYDAVAGGIVAAHQFATYIPWPAVQAQFLTYVNAAFTAGLSDAMFAGAVVIALIGVLAYLILPNAVQPPKG